MRAEIMSVGRDGPTFTLRPPWTAATVKAEIRRHEAGNEPLRCRISHRWQTIGDVYCDEDDLVGSVLSLAAARFTRDLAWCRRCGFVATRGR